MLVWVDDFNDTVIARVLFTLAGYNAIDKQGKMFV